MSEKEVPYICECGEPILNDKEKEEHECPEEKVPA